MKTKIAQEVGDHPDALSGSLSVNKFIQESLWSDACMEGAEAAHEMRLPEISVRWVRADLRDAWLHGFVTEIRNRMENK